MTSPAFDQDSYRWRNDNGDETSTGATWIAALNTAPPSALPVDTNLRLRILIQETNSRSNVQAFEWWVSRNSGAYQQITTTSSVVKAVDSTYLTDGNSCTQQLGSGTFISANQGQSEDGLWDTVNFTSLSEWEGELSFQIVGADVNNSDTLDFRIYKSGGTVINTYTRTPRLIVSKTTSWNVNKSDSVGITESKGVVLNDVVVNKSETISLSEFRNVLFEFFVSNTETISLSDPPLIYVPPADPDIPIQDSILVTDIPDVDAPYEILPPLSVFPVGWKIGVKIVG